MPLRQHIHAVDQHAVRIAVDGHGVAVADRGHRRRGELDGADLLGIHARRRADAHAVVGDPVQRAQGHRIDAEIDVIGDPGQGQRAQRCIDRHRDLAGRLQCGLEFAQQRGPALGRRDRREADGAGRDGQRARAGIVGHVAAHTGLDRALQVAQHLRPGGAGGGGVEALAVDDDQIAAPGDRIDVRRIGDGLAADGDGLRHAGELRCRPGHRDRRAVGGHAEHTAIQHHGEVGIAIDDRIGKIDDADLLNPRRSERGRHRAGGLQRRCRRDADALDAERRVVRLGGQCQRIGTGRAVGPLADGHADRLAGLDLQAQLPQQRRPVGGHGGIVRSGRRADGGLEAVGDLGQRRAAVRRVGVHAGTDVQAVDGMIDRGQRRQIDDAPGFRGVAAADGYQVGARHRTDAADGNGGDAGPLGDGDDLAGAVVAGAVTGMGIDQAGQLRADGIDVVTALRGIAECGRGTDGHRVHAAAHRGHAGQSDGAVVIRVGDVGIVDHDAAAAGGQRDAGGAGAAGDGDDVADRRGGGELRLGMDCVAQTGDDLRQGRIGIRGVAAIDRADTDGVLRVVGHGQAAEIDGPVVIDIGDVGGIDAGAVDGGDAVDGRGGHQSDVGIVHAGQEQQMVAAHARAVVVVVDQHRIHHAGLRRRAAEGQIADLRGGRTGLHFRHAAVGADRAADRRGRRYDLDLDRAQREGIGGAQQQRLSGAVAGHVDTGRRQQRIQRIQHRGPVGGAGVEHVIGAVQRDREAAMVAEHIAEQDAILLRRSIGRRGGADHGVVGTAAGGRVGELRHRGPAHGQAGVGQRGVLDLQFVARAPVRVDREHLGRLLGRAGCGHVHRHRMAEQVGGGLVQRCGIAAGVERRIDLLGGQRQHVAGGAGGDQRAGVGLDLIGDGGQQRRLAGVVGVGDRHVLPSRRPHDDGFTLGIGVRGELQLADLRPRRGRRRRYRGVVRHGDVQADGLVAGAAGDGDDVAARAGIVGRVAVDRRGQAMDDLGQRRRGIGGVGHACAAEVEHIGGVVGHGNAAQIERSRRAGAGAGRADDDARRRRVQVFAQPGGGERRAGSQCQRARGGVDTDRVRLAHLDLELQCTQDGGPGVGDDTVDHLAIGHLIGELAGADLEHVADAGRGRGEAQGTAVHLRSRGEHGGDRGIQSFDRRAPLVSHGLGIDGDGAASRLLRTLAGTRLDAVDVDQVARHDHDGVAASDVADVAHVQIIAGLDDDGAIGGEDAINHQSGGFVDADVAADRGIHGQPIDQRVQLHAVAGAHFQRVGDEHGSAVGGDRRGVDAQPADVGIGGDDAAQHGHGAVHLEVDVACVIETADAADEAGERQAAAQIDGDVAQRAQLEGGCRQRLGVARRLGQDQVEEAGRGDAVALITAVGAVDSLGDFALAAGLQQHAVDLAVGIAAAGVIVRLDADAADEAQVLPGDQFQPLVGAEHGSLINRYGRTSGIGGQRDDVALGTGGIAGQRQRQAGDDLGQRGIGVGGVGAGDTIDVDRVVGVVQHRQLRQIQAAGMVDVGHVRRRDDHVADPGAHAQRAAGMQDDGVGRNGGRQHARDVVADTELHVIAGLVFDQFRRREEAVELDRLSRIERDAARVHQGIAAGGRIDAQLAVHTGQPDGVAADHGIGADQDVALGGDADQAVTADAGDRVDDHQTRRQFTVTVEIGELDVAGHGDGIQAVHRDLQLGDAGVGAQGQPVGDDVHAGIAERLADAATGGLQPHVARRAGAGIAQLHAIGAFQHRLVVVRRGIHAGRDEAHQDVAHRRDVDVRLDIAVGVLVRQDAQVGDVDPAADLVDEIAGREREIAIGDPDARQGQRARALGDADIAGARGFEDQAVDLGGQRQAAGDAHRQHVGQQCRVAGDVDVPLDVEGQVAARAVLQADHGEIGSAAVRQVVRGQRDVVAVAAAQRARIDHRHGAERGHVDGAVGGDGAGQRQRLLVDQLDVAGVGQAQVGEIDLDIQAHAVVGQRDQHVGDDATGCLLAAGGAIGQGVRDLLDVAAGRDQVHRGFDAGRLQCRAIEHDIAAVQAGTQRQIAAGGLEVSLAVAADAAVLADAVAGGDGDRPGRDLPAQRDVAVGADHHGGGVHGAQFAADGHVAQ